MRSLTCDAGRRKQLCDTNGYVVLLQKTSSEQFPILYVHLVSVICSVIVFPSCFSCEVEDEEEMALTTGWNSPDRPLCLLSPKMSKRTVLSAFLRLTRSSAQARVSDSRTDCFLEFHWRPKPDLLLKHSEPKSIPP